MSINLSDRRWFSLFILPLIAIALGSAGLVRAESSILTLSAELPASELSNWLNAALPDQFVGDGAQKVCKRVLGIKACGDTRWQYRVQKTGKLVIARTQDADAGLSVGVPLSVRGNVGVEGDMGRLLGLNAVPIAADLVLSINTRVSGSPQGCPVLQASLTPQWRTKPSVVLPGNLKISLSAVLEKALADQVQSVQKQINQALDCDAILAHLTPLWSLCHVDATQEKTGPSVWAITPQKIHWSVQTARADQTYALVAGIDADLSLQMGLTQQQVDLRLRDSDCARTWDKLQTPSTQTVAKRKDEHSAGAKVVFDPMLSSGSTQGVRLNITHQAMTAFAQTRYANRNLGQDKDGNELTIGTVNVEPVNLNDESAVALQTQFNATVRAGKGIGGWFQRVMGFGEKSLNGVMRVEAKPVWNSSTRTLQFEALKAKVTDVDPGNKLSLTHAAFVLMERHAQKILTEQSTIALGDAIDALSLKINDAVDPLVQQQLSPYGGEWRKNTASVEVNDLLAIDKGMTLDAQFNADWVIRFSSESWPTDFAGLTNLTNRQRR